MRIKYTKLSKATKNNINEVIVDLRKGINYIKSEKTALCRKDKTATTTLHFTRKCDNAVLYELNKDIGSELNYIYNALCNLEKLLTIE